MRRNKFRGIGKAALASIFAIGVTLSASGTALAGPLVYGLCGAGGELVGVTTSTQARTIGNGNCNTTISVRGYYVHVGGASWTTWYNAPGGGSGQKIVNTSGTNNITTGQHKATGSGTLTSYA